MAQLLQIAAIAAATAGTGAATLSVMNQDVPDLAVPAGDWSPGGQLDGQSFEIRGNDLDNGEYHEDVIVFRDGTFQSTDCQKYCDFGWSDYQTKVVGDVLHFTVRTSCPDAPHTVVWYGTVEDDVLQIELTWTTRRWYWTHQIAIAGQGEVIPDAEDAPAG